MALVTPHIQGTYSMFLSRPLAWNKGLKLKPHRVTFQVKKCSYCLSVGSPHIDGAKHKSLRISAFKSASQNDEPEIRASNSKPGKNSVNFTYGPETTDEALRKSPKAQNVPLSYAEPNNSIGGSPAIHNLFKSWLTMLRTQSPGQVGDGIVVEASSEEILGTEKEVLTKGRGVIVMTALNYFLGLDARIKIPLLMFIPGYLSVYAVYGAEVAKELTPLWVLGPVIVALYIQILRGIVAVYIFTFKQTCKLIKNCPTYARVSYAFVKEGRLWQPLVNITTMDYKLFARRKMNELKDWSAERWLDYVESIWPLYCKITRFLRRANFI